MASLQTRDCIMHIARVCRRGSLIHSVDWHGSNLYDPHISVDRTRRGHGNGIEVLATQQALPHHCRHHWLEQKDAEWAKYTSNNVCVGKCGGTLSLTGRISGLSNDHPSDNCRTDGMLAYYVHSVCSFEKGTRETCIHARHHLISGQHDIARSTNPRSISHNWYEPYCTAVHVGTEHGVCTLLLLWNFTKLSSTAEVK